MLFAMLLIKPSSFILYNLEKNVCSKSLTLLQDIFWNFLQLASCIIVDSKYWTSLNHLVADSLDDSFEIKLLKKYSYFKKVLAAKENWQY